MSIEKILTKTVQAIEANNVSVASCEISKALKIAPKNFSVVYFAGIISVMSKDYKQAISYFKKAIKINPQIPEVYFNIAKAYTDLNMDGDAILYHKKFLQKNPENINGLINYGLSLIKLNQVTEAKQCYLKVIGIDEKNTLALLNLGALYFQEKKYSIAIITFEKIISYDESLIDAWIGLGRAYAGVYDYEKAENAFKKAVIINPYNELALEYFGIFLVAIKKYDEALNFIGDAINKNPSSKLYELIGDIYSDLSNLDFAINYFLKAIELDNNNIQSINKLALRLIDRNDLKTAKKLLSELLDRFPSDFETLNNYSIVLLNLKDYDDALLYVKKAIKIQPSYHTFNNLGTIEKKLFRYEESISSFLKTITINPNYIDGYVNLAILYNEIGNLEKSNKYFEVATTLDCQNSNLKINKSIIKLQHKKFQEGWSEYEARWDVPPYKYSKLANLRQDMPLQKNNKQIIFLQEQGVGDLILYSSIIKELEDLPKYSLAIDSRLHSVYSRSFPNVSLMDISLLVESNLNPNFIYVPIGNLGAPHRPNEESFDLAVFPYLIPDFKTVNSFKNKINVAGKRICGVSWRSYNEVYGDKKSLNLNSLINLLEGFQQIKFLNLQYGVLDTEADYIKQHVYDFEDFSFVDKKNDFESIFAMVEICDFIITTSSTVAHIAGSLGKDTYLLLPKGDGQLWYWHTRDNSNVSLWYPSIKVFKQNRFGDWEDPIRSVRSIIENL